MDRMGRRIVPAMLVAPIYAAAPPPLAGQETADCGDRASLIVTVRDDAGTMQMPNATVVLRWTDAVRRPVREATDVTGHLVLCVPRDARRATLWAEFGDASSEEEVVVIVPGMRHEVQLRLLLAARRTGRLIGQVLDARTRQPVVAAEILVPDRAERVESNRRGRFVLSALPVGEHELSVRHIGYSPLTHAVVVRQGLTTEAEIALSADPVELAPLVATVERPRRLEIKGLREKVLG